MFTACCCITAPSTTVLPIPISQPNVINVFLLQPSPICHSTLPGIHKALYNTLNLVYVANGPVDGAQYGLNTLATPSSLEASPYPPVPPYPVLLQPGDMRVFDLEVDPHFAWIVAQGWHAWALYLDCSLWEAAFNIASAEGNVPGLLGQLTQVLFPGGIREYDLALDPAGLEVVKDFIHGRFAVMHEFG